MRTKVVFLSLKVPLRGRGVRIALTGALALALTTYLAAESFLPYSIILAALTTSSAILADSGTYSQLISALILCGFRRDRSWLVLLFSALFLSTISMLAGVPSLLTEPTMIVLYPTLSIALSFSLAFIEVREAMIV